MELGPLQLQWIESLEQNPDRQGFHRLGEKFDDGTYKACCLGEGGLIAGVCEWRIQGRLERNILTVIGSDETGMLGSHAYEALGLRGGNGAPTENRYSSLVSLNDRKIPWPEIASILRKNPEQYFTESK